MRILLDSCIPHSFRLQIPGHDVTTAKYAGLDPLTNGALLAAMRGTFDVLVTCDRSIPRQQNLSNAAVALIVLRARSNRLQHLQPLVPELLAELLKIRPGEVREIAAT